MMFDLSICIPTFNRAEFLDKTLANIVNQDVFKHSNQIEVVVSDNCSTDNTFEIVEKYTKLYPEKIKYFRNDKNVGDKNFGLVLSHATGEFLKLHNDVLLFRHNSLDEILNLITKSQQKKYNLFFIDGNSKLKEKTTKCTNFEEFVKHVSYMSTWLGGFGIWKKDFKTIGDFSEKSDSFLSQTHVLFNLAANKQTIVYNPQCMYSQKLSLSGNYNLMEVFIQNYLNLFQPYLKNGKLSNAVFEEEKWKVLEEHVLPRYFNIGHEFKYKKDNFWKHTRQYHKSWRFYNLLIKVFIKKLNEICFLNKKGCYLKFGNKIKIRLWSPKWIYIYSDKKGINIKIADKFKTRLWPLYKKGTNNYAKSTK